MQHCQRLTESQRKKLLEAIRGGAVYLDMAGIYAGIPDTVRLELALEDVAKWQQRVRERENGEKVNGRPPAWLLELDADIEQARGHALVRAVASILAQGRKNAEHLKWFLAHVQPHHWAEISRMELTGKDGGPVQLSLLDMLAAAHAKRKKAGDE